MKKNNMLRCLRFAMILIASIFFFQVQGHAQSMLEEQAVEILYFPQIFKFYIYEEPEGNSTVRGVISDARTGLPIDRVEVCLNKDLKCVVSDINGEYELPEVPAGGYTLTTEHPNYAPFWIENLNVPAGSIVTANIKLLPILEEGQLRVVVTWDPTPAWPSGPIDVPNDLNLHLWIRTYDPPDYHIYEGNKGNCLDLNAPPYACYESEVQFGSGPDAIVFLDQDTEIYSIAVLNYNDSWPGVPPITDLDALVQVYDSTGLRIEYRVPLSGEGDLWYVFDLEFGKFTRQDCLLQYDQEGGAPAPCPQ